MSSSQKALDSAIEDFFVANQCDGVLTGYVLVATHETYINGNRAFSYETVMMDGFLPTHVAEGLLRMGVRSLHMEDDEIDD